jgi:hypothetical protein
MDGVPRPLGKGDAVLPLHPSRQPGESPRSVSSLAHMGPDLKPEKARKGGPMGLIAPQTCDRVFAPVATMERPLSRSRAGLHAPGIEPAAGHSRPAERRCA